MGSCVRVDTVTPTSSPWKTHITPCSLGPPGTRKPGPPPLMHANEYPFDPESCNDSWSTSPPVASAPFAAPWMIVSAATPPG